VIATLPLIPQEFVIPGAPPHPEIGRAVDSIISHVNDAQPLVPNQVDFVEFMMALHGNASKMDGTAVTADELWSLGENDPIDELLAGVPNGGRPDHRYLQSEDDAPKLLGPVVVSVGGGAVPAGAWETATA